VCVRGVVIVACWAFRLCGPIGRLITASRFTGAVSTAAIKIMGGSLLAQPVFHYYDCPVATLSCSCSISASRLLTIFAILRR
jgi:hypothetical protein